MICGLDEWARGSLEGSFCVLVLCAGVACRPENI